MSTNTVLQQEKEGRVREVKITMKEKELKNSDTEKITHWSWPRNWDIETLEIEFALRTQLHFYRNNS